jgi:hypothetical protein
MELKIITSASSSMASPAYQVSWKLPAGSKLLGGGHKDRKIDDLISLHLFFESSLKKEQQKLVNCIFMCRLFMSERIICGRHKCDTVHM